MEKFQYTKNRQNEKKRTILQTVFYFHTTGNTKVSEGGQTGYMCSLKSIFLLVFYINHHSLSLYTVSFGKISFYCQV